MAAYTHQIRARRMLIATLLVASLVWVGVAQLASETVRPMQSNCAICP